MGHRRAGRGTVVARIVLLQQVALLLFCCRGQLAPITTDCHSLHPCNSRSDVSLCEGLSPCLVLLYSRHRAEQPRPLADTGATHTSPLQGCSQHKSHYLTDCPPDSQKVCVWLWPPSDAQQRSWKWCLPHPEQPLLPCR